MFFIICLQPTRRSLKVTKPVVVAATPPTPKITVIQNEPAIIVKDDMSEDSDEFMDTLDGACGGHSYDDKFEKSK